MTSGKKWLTGGAIVAVVVVVGLFLAASIVAKRVEPYIREQAIAYMKNRFAGDVELGKLRVHVPAGLSIRSMFNPKGTLAHVEGEELVLRQAGRADGPALFRLKKFEFQVDLGALLETPKRITRVTLDGMEIQIPPKGERPKFGKGERSSGNVIISEVVIHDARLVILPRDTSKNPLDFELHEIRLKDAGKDAPMAYSAELTNPKPPGRIHSTGTFGPWVAEEPSDTPLAGEYLFENADLGVFSVIAGTLRSTGNFTGTLSSIVAKGEASVPNFQLKSVGNPVPLSTTFEVLVDGMNGNTELKPVVATLGSTHFTTTGFVVKHLGDKQRTIFIDAKIPDGNLRDALRLAMKGTPMMEGKLKLNAKIGIPPLAEKVKEKITVDGAFEVNGGRFLRSAIQTKLNGLSHQSQGKHGGEEVEEAVHRMSGEFRMADEAITFKTLAFSIPGAAVNLGGVFRVDADELDFHGSLMLDATVSETQSGWKRWVLKPVDPFFSKRGAGTFLHIKVTGSAKDPQFGLDRGGTSPAEEAEKKLQ